MWEKCKEKERRIWKEEDRKKKLLAARQIIGKVEDLNLGLFKNAVATSKVEGNVTKLFKANLCGL